MFPKLITRYVIFELLKVLLVSSAAFVLLMLLVGLAQKAKEHGIGPDIVVQLVPFLLPEALMFAIPATSLFSVCVVFGRMASDNEVTALESLGLSKSMIVLPAIVLAFGLSLFAVWLNDIAHAWSHLGIERVVLHSTDKIVYGVLRQEGSFRSDKFSIEVDAVEGRTLIQPTVEINSDQKSSFRMTAATGELKVNPANHSLMFRMDRGMIDSKDKFTLLEGDKSTYEIPLRSSEDFSISTTNPSNLYLSQISREVEDHQYRLDAAETDMSMDATMQWLTGDYVGLTTSDWQSRNNKLKVSRNRFNKLNVVPHRRWANGFSCLAFAIVGIPVALRLKTGNYATTFGLCFVPILLLYYPLFMFGLNGAKTGVLPPFTVWLGNIGCLIVGLVLLQRELRK